MAKDIKYSRPSMTGSGFGRQQENTPLLSGTARLGPWGQTN